MIRTTSQVIDVWEADAWVMDPRVIYSDEIEPMPDINVSRVKQLNAGESHDRSHHS